MRRIGLILVCFLFLGVRPAQAQDGILVTFTAPEISQFPAISTYLDVHRAGGGFVQDLTADQVTVIEDGTSIAVDQLNVIEAGVDWIVAVNAGSPLGIRDSQGVSRYERLTQVLKNWAVAESPSDADAFSFFANSSTSTIQTASRQEWLAALEAYQPDFRNSTPSLESLLNALDLTTSTAPGPGMERAILWITPPPEGELLDSLSSLTERAVESRTRIYIWMVSSAAVFDSENALALQGMADQTGGLFVPFSGTEAMPDPEEYLTQLRSIYQVVYASAINTTGEHTVAFQVTIDGAVQKTAEQTLQVDIQSPNPMFLSPPTQIVRTCPADSKEPLADLTPLTYPIQILVEFPDGHSRSLASTRYYVDGELAAEISEAPFDEFTWDIRSYTTSGTHTLRVEVEDELGFSKSSLEIPVDIVIEIPPASLWTTILRNQTALYVGAVGLAGFSLVLVLFLATRWRKHAAALKKLRQQRDPLTQPVEHITPPVEAAPVETHRTTRGGPAAASIIRLRMDNRTSIGDPIPISHREFTIGRDPTRAIYVLDDPSVDSVHARLRQTADGHYLLSDQDSVAGTWVNYAPVSAEGARLENGDLIHIGQVAFRFVLDKPPQPRKAVIQPYHEGL